MKLEIKTFFSADVEDLFNLQEKSTECIYFHLEIEVGEFGGAGGTVFQLVVSTPEGVQKKHVGEARKAFDFLKNRNIEFGRNALLIINNYSWDALTEKLEKIVKSCEKDTWEDSVYELRKNFFWEYEGLQSV